MKLKAAGRLAVVGFLCAYSVITKAQTVSNSRSDIMNGVTRLNIMTDSEQGADKTMILEKNGEKYRIRVINNKITELEVNGTKQPESEFPKYEKMVTALLEQIARDHAQAEKDRLQADRDRERANRERERADVERAHAEEERNRADAERRIADKQRDLADQSRARADRERAQANADRERADRERTLADKERAAAHEARDEAYRQRLSADADRARADEDRKHADRDRIRAAEDRKRAEIDRKKAEEDRKIFEALIDDLVSDKLIKSKSDFFDIDLSAEGFTVDGKQQPDALHEKYKTRYLKQKKVIRMSSDGNSRTIRMNEKN